jgi:hypothetical protein
LLRNADFGFAQTPRGLVIRAIDRFRIGLIDDGPSEVEDRLRAPDAASRNRYRPSIDYFFEPIRRLWDEFSHKMDEFS